MSADSAETVRKSREILDSGIDPTRLTSQLAGLIMDIIAGTHQLVSLKSSDIALWGRRLTESELDRLQQALKILSDAEKQLRHSCEQSTWFTAALLQLGSGYSVESADSSGSCSKHNIPDVSSYRSPGFMLKFQHSNSSTVPGMLSQHSSPHVAVSDVPSRENSNNRGNSQSKVESNSRVNLDCGCPEKLEGIWKECIVGCHSKSLRTLLSAHGKLVSISEVEGVLVANVTFQDASTKSRGERFLSSITNSFENLLKRNVKVQIGFSSDSYMDKEASQELSKYAVGDGLANVKGERESGDVSHYLTSSQKHTVNLLREDIDMAESRFEGSAAPDESVSVGSVPNFNRRQLDYEKNGKRLDIPVQISVAATSGQHFECTWQASDKTTAPGSADKQKLESNKVLPQNGFICHKHNIVTAVTSKHWEDELNLEFEAFKINDGQAHLKEENAEKIPQFPIASSPLHNDIDTSSIGEEHIGYDSAPGCSGLLCWQHHRTKIGTKVKRINRIKSKRQNQISCLGRRTSTKSSRSRLDH